ncbi:hypothetical protein [Micromonospora purpureochromogenes]|uniref:Uncharacterized protein n=1 Tax=Micromonospora purpureochromogenes TaxID=47872 RepID=A0ABX2RWV8_9ACTN|nr:hypothetical protein [Micromonospora purpureochromogenes]NYF59739.1 hypothetical protein [Micromonospora purpureochromogenes]
MTSGVPDQPRDDGSWPRWLKLLVLVLAIAALVAVAVMLLGGVGGHGPARHFGLSGTVVPSGRA